jgi:hypothetical protein
MSLVALRLFVQNSPINSAVLTGNGNMAKPRRNLNKMTKECPAPQSEAPTLLLTPFSTHLSFCWTLPLTDIYFLCRASPVSRIKIAAPIVLVQHKGHKRIGKAWKQFHRTLPFGPQITI